MRRDKRRRIWEQNGIGKRRNGIWKNKFDIFNIGFENLAILKIAKIIAKEIGAKIIVKKNKTDPRSYNLDSSKIIKLGFVPKKNIIAAIREFKEYYYSGKFVEKPNYHSIKWLKRKKL